MSTPLLRMHGIVKRYPGVVALNGVSFELMKGEVHCLVGENGAGKSTLMRILSGATAMDAGEIVLNGTPVVIGSPSTARQLGISTIYQEAGLVPDLDAAENIFLGNEPTRFFSILLDTNALHKRARAILEQLGEEIDTREPVRNLSTAQRQIVSIAKAFSRRVRILVMDEPTASLTGNEIVNLFAIIRRLKSEGIGVIHISHRLDEIFTIGDRVSVLRDGANITTASISNVKYPDLIRWMVGRDLENEFPAVIPEHGNEILRVENVASPLLKNVSLTLHQGEILGFAGLVGAGRTELARILSGADRKTSGTMHLFGERYEPDSPAAAIRRGVGRLTEDRNNEGLLLEMNVRENITMSNLRSLSRFSFINESKERRIASDYFERLHIKAESTETEVRTLSGGNRQKVVLGRWLSTDSRILIFDEPTVGIDVGVKYEIHQRIHQLAKDGVGIIVISSDMPELLGLCTRIVVLCNGRITGVLRRGEATQEKILMLATQFGAGGKSR